MKLMTLKMVDVSFAFNGFTELLMTFALILVAKEYLYVVKI